MMVRYRSVCVAAAVQKEVYFFYLLSHQAAALNGVKNRRTKAVFDTYYAEGETIQWLQRARERCEE